MIKVLTWTEQTLVVPFGAKFYVRCASMKVTHAGARSAPISKNKVPLDSRWHRSNIHVPWRAGAGCYVRLAEASALRRTKIPEPTGDVTVVSENYAAPERCSA